MRNAKQHIKAFYDLVTKPKSIPSSIPSSGEIEARLSEIVKKKNSLKLILDIINKCNLRCIMCRFSDHDELKEPLSIFTPEEFKSLFEKIGPYVGDVRLSCGDEPMTSKYFPKILQILSSDPTPRKIGFATNATLMNAHVRNLLMENGVTYVFLSMDGVKKSTFERIRVGADYEQVVGNILALRDLKKAVGTPYPIMTVIFVMFNSNIAEAPAMVGLAERLGARRVQFQHVVPNETYDGPDELLGNYKSKYNYYREQIVQAARNHHIDLLLPPAFDVDDIWQPQSPDIDVDLSDFEKIVPDHSSLPAPVPKPPIPFDFAATDVVSSIANEFKGVFCHYPFSQMMITDKREVRPCPHYKGSLGSLRSEQSLSDIFFGEGFQRLRHNMYLSERDPGCKECPIKSGLLN